MSALRELSSHECLRLLHAGVIGRVAVMTPDGPHLVPVNYAMAGDDVVFATTPYSLLGTHGPGARAAFEIDDVDYPRQSGWSVTVKGRLRVEDDLDEIARVRTTWPPRPWAEGTRSLLLRLEPLDLTGRRLGGGTSLVSPPVQQSLGWD